MLVVPITLSSSARDAKFVCGIPDIDIEGKGIKILLLTPDDAIQYDKPYQQLREEFLLNR
jgi:hypothetical protein